MTRTYDADDWDNGFETGRQTYAPSAAEVANEEERSRARAIRAVVAAQWAVALALFKNPPHGAADGGMWAMGYVDAMNMSIIWVAALPTAEQIVDGAV